MIFRSIEFPDAFCVNTVIKVCSCNCVPQNALLFYFEMLKNGFFPNSYTFPPLLSSCVKMGCFNFGVKCHGQTVKHGVNGQLPVQNSLIYLYACFGLMSIARQVCTEMSVQDLVSWNTILYGFAKNGDLYNAHKLFDRMPRKNVISWNALMTGYLEGCNHGGVLNLFRKMVEIGLMGNGTTVVNLLTACGRSVRLKEGRSVHGFIFKGFVNLSLIIDTALIDMYGKCGRPDIARRIFDRMSTRNLVCWNAMVVGHCLHGNPRDGLNLYAEMVGTTMSDHGETDFGKPINPDRKQPILPDEITFIGVLCACAREGLLSDGKKYLTEMTEVFHLRPNFAHNWCLANLFANVGLMEEAVELLRNTRVDGDISLVADLLSSCRFQGDVIWGEQLANALIEIDPQDFRHYALLFNIYAVAGQWDKVAIMREVINEKGYKRTPGCSLADLKEMVHGFTVGHLVDSFDQMSLSTLILERTSAQDGN